MIKSILRVLLGLLLLNGMTCMITANHLPLAGEYEIKNAQAIKIINSFGVGVSFTKHYIMGFWANAVLMGHDRFGHMAIADTGSKSPASCCALYGGHIPFKVQKLGELLKPEVIWV